MIPLYGISNLLIMITSLGISIFVFVKGPRNKTNKIWTILTLSIAIYGFGGYMVSLSENAHSALFWWQVAYIGIILIPVLFMHFVCSFLDIKRPFLLRIIYFLTSVVWILNIFAKDLFLGNVSLFFENSKIFKSGYWIYPPTPFLIFYIIFIFGGIAILSHIELIKGYKRADHFKRYQIKYFFLGTVLGFIGGGTSYLPCFNIRLYPALNILVVLYPLITSYAIVRHRLMDIRIAVTRTGIFVVVYSLVLGLPFAVAFWLKDWLIETFRASWWILPLGLMAALATVGPFIYIYLQRKAEDRLLADQRRYQDTLKQASIGMTRIRDLQRLLDLIAHIMTKTVRITYVGIYLFDAGSGEYVLQVSRDKGRLPVPKLASSNPLVNWLILKPQPLIYDEIKLRAQDSSDLAHKQLEENMRLLTAAVIIPSFLENRLLGFIVLGEKISGHIYTQEDLNVFQVLAGQAALAIENAQFYEEAKKMQEQIAQAEKMATIGTMADGLSHQINNRLYALSLIAGDTIDTIKLTDTTKCTPEVKEMIGQINYALERIQANVMQGGEVVRGLLKYSRQGDSGLDALDLHTILNNTLEMVQYKVKLSEIDIVRDFPPNIAKIKGNLTQLEEAFFNFIDNAYDAIVERRTLLKEAGYRGRITVSAYPKDEHLEIVVEDNGLGVKEADMKKIFTPFFTTKTSSHKGTGLGLYVIKRIITEMHKGQISFESDYKVGTRFIIQLPIAK